MRIVLATGIYPPDIGGPATYVQNLARELTSRGERVTVVTYARHVHAESNDPWTTVRVSKRGGTVLRWQRYAAALRREGKDADIVYAFSAMSCGIPLHMARLKHPRKILRLGGDFLWERYTDAGGRKTLQHFYRAYPGFKNAMKPVLGGFDHLIFSTDFQRALYERVYRKLPPRRVIENAVPERELTLHERHEPLRLLFLGRFVRFKNLPSLLASVASLPHVRLTLVGDGPVTTKTSLLVRKLSIQNRVSFLPSAHGAEKDALLREHDVLVLPSLTEISPHSALEARAAGMPVLLTQENGLSELLQSGMVVTSLRTSADITRAILDIDHRYEEVAHQAAVPYAYRPWSTVCDEHMALFDDLLRKKALSGKA